MCKFIIATVALVCTAMGAPQVSFRHDGATNSYSLSTPGHSQSFTRYFGGQAPSLLDAAQTQQHAQAVPATQAIQYQYSPQGGQYDYQQQLAAAAQNTQYQPQRASFYPQPAPQLQPQQVQQPQQQQQAEEQPLSAQDFQAYFQQVQEAQQLARQQQQAASIPSAQPQPQPQQRQQPQAYSSPVAASSPLQPANAPVRLSYSPSNEVSQVKFSSNGLSYNF